MEHVSPHEEERNVANQVPGCGGVPVGAGAETPAVYIEPAGRIENQSAEKQDQEAVGQGDGPRQPETAQEANAEHEFEPGENDGREVDEAVGKELIIVNDFGEGTRIVDLSDAGGEEDAAQRQPEPEVHGLLQWIPHGVDIAPSDRSAVVRPWDVGVEVRPVGERVIGGAAVRSPSFRRGAPAPARPSSRSPAP